LFAAVPPDILSTVLFHLQAFREMTITADQVSQLAPDGSSAAAGRKLMGLKNWSDLGVSSGALWGKCQGSALYQVKIDLATLVSSCSCPSRKFPCKHALGLLFLHAESPAAAPVGEPPEWVEEWLAKRRGRQEKSSERTTDQLEKPVDVKAQQKRAEQREARVSEGLERLDLWIRDLVRNGLAGLESRPPSFWDEQSRRLVDAQAPGLSSRLSALGELPGASPNWPAQMLGELGRIKLLIHAWQRIEQLDASLQSDIRQIIGWNVSQEELAERTDGVEDVWCVVGQTTTDEKPLRIQRAWLLGRETGRWVLVVQFATAGQPFAELLPVGTERRGTVVYYPGVSEQRGKLVRQEGGIAEVANRLSGTARINDFLGGVSSQLGRLPWARTVCGLFQDVTVVPRENEWVLRDDSGQGLPLSRKNHWKLLALTGGAPCDVVAEWDGNCLHPLGLYLQERYRAI
jgi:hypothetical protein